MKRQKAIYDIVFFDTGLHFKSYDDALKQDRRAGIGMLILYV